MSRSITPEARARINAALDEIVAGSRSEVYAEGYKLGVEHTTKRLHDVLDKLQLLRQRIPTTHSMYSALGVIIAEFATAIGGEVWHDVPKVTEALIVKASEVRVGDKIADTEGRNSYTAVTMIEHSGGALRFMAGRFVVCMAYPHETISIWRVFA